MGIKLVPVFAVEDSEDLDTKLTSMKYIYDRNVPFGIKIRGYWRYDNGYDGLFSTLRKEGITNLYAVIIDQKFADIPRELKRQLEEIIIPLHDSAPAKHGVAFKEEWYTVRYDTMASKGFDDIMLKINEEWRGIGIFGVIELTSVKPEYSILDDNKKYKLPVILYERLSSVGLNVGFVLPGTWIPSCILKGYNGPILCPGLKPKSVEDTRKDQVKTAPVETIVEIVKESGYNNTLYIVLGSLARSIEGASAYVREMGYEL